MLYYEPKLPLLWSVLSRVVRAGGTVIIRVPNKVLPVRLGQLWFRWSRTRMRRLLQDRIPFFNPEHIFLLRRRHLQARLRSIGFTQVRTVPSPLLSGSMPSICDSALFRLASIANRVSRQALVLTPSMLLIGTHRHPRLPDTRRPT